MPSDIAALQKRTYGNDAGFYQDTRHTREPKQKSRYTLTRYIELIEPELASLTVLVP
jgi:hypothetical protein